MPELTTIEVHGPLNEVLHVLVRMRGTKQIGRVGDLARLRIGGATATVTWVEAVQRTVIRVNDPDHGSAATSACARLMSKLPHPVARFD